MCAVVRIPDPSNPGTCCPCSNQDGCQCSGGNCSLQCRTRVGTATLCGFDEFGTPSNPPRKFRKKTVKTDSGDPFKTCDYGSNDCSLPACQVTSYSDHYNDGTVIMTGSLNNNGPGAPGFISYTASISCTINGIPAAATLECTGSSGFANGQTKDISTGANPAQAFMFVPFGLTGTGSPPRCIFIGQPFIFISADSWDYTGQYITDPDDPTSCLLTENQLSFRENDTKDSCVGGTGHVVPFTCGVDPETCYAGGSTIVGTNTSVTVSGIGCVPIMGGGSVLYAGSVAQDLSDEDTPQDAINRATSHQTWLPTSRCDPADGGTAFIAQGNSTDVTYRQAQVRGIAPVIPGHNYEMTIGLYARILGSSGPFISTGLVIEVNFEAVQPIEVTDWFDILCDTGFETQAKTCLLVDKGT